jgi:hypothetical protein
MGLTMRFNMERVQIENAVNETVSTFLSASGGAAIVFFGRTFSPFLNVAVKQACGFAATVSIVACIFKKTLFPENNFQNNLLAHTLAGCAVYGAGIYLCPFLSIGGPAAAAMTATSLFFSQSIACILKYNHKNHLAPA